MVDNVLFSLIRLVIHLTKSATLVKHPPSNACCELREAVSGRIDELEGDVEQLKLQTKVRCACVFD